jgi:hypothetical protein
VDAERREEYKEEGLHAVATAAIARGIHNINLGQKEPPEGSY